MPAYHEVVRTGLAGHEQDAQVRQVLLDRRQQGGDAGEIGDAPLQQKIRQVAADQAGSRLSGHQRRTGEQRNPKLLDREIEGNRHALIGAVAFADSVHLGRHLHEIADAGMLDRDALRGAGRAGGVDDVGELVGGRRLLAVGEADRLFCIDFRLGGIEENLPDGELAELRAERRHRDDRLHVGVPHDEPDPLIGKAGVERDIGGVDFQHRQQRHIGIGGLVEHEAYPVAGCQPLLDQKSRDLVGAIVETPKRERRLIGDHRQRGAVARRVQLIAPFFEQVVEPFACLPANRVVGVLANQHLSLTLARECGPPSVGQGGLPEGGRAGLCGRRSACSRQSRRFFCYATSRVSRSACRRDMTGVAALTVPNSCAIA